MRAIAIALGFLLTAPAALADEPPPRTPVPTDTLTEDHGWVTDVVAMLNLSQAAYSHWQEGGIDALAATTNLRGRFARVSGPFRQRHDTRLSFGVLQQDTLEIRKAVDVIRYTFDLQLDVPGDWRPTFATEFRTQFAPGFDYDPSPERYPDLGAYMVRGQPLKVSDFLAPAQWTQSLGMSYEPFPWLSSRAGLGLKETIVLIERLRPVYGNRPDQPVRLQAGLDALIEARGEPFDNVLVQSRLSVFQAFTDFAEAAPDLFWETMVQLQVNTWLSVNGEFGALYDRDVLDRIQLKQLLSIGVSVTLM